MRERYETLKLSDLRALAKIRGIKSVTTLKKSEIIDAMVELDEKELKTGNKAVSGASVERDVSDKKVSDNTLSDNGDADKPSSDKGASDNASFDSGAAPAKPQGASAGHAHGDGRDRRHDNKHDIRHDNKKTFIKDTRQESRPESKTDRKDNTVDKASDKPIDKPADKPSEEPATQQEVSGVPASGILEVMPDGFGFIRCENYLPGENDVYVAPAIIRKLGLRTGDILEGIAREKSGNDKFGALIKLGLVNGYLPEMAATRTSFQKMTPIFPNEKLNLEREGGSIAMRIMDLICPIGKGQRGMIVSPPKAGKTTLLKDVAKSIQKNYPKIHLIILLIDERPEEVTDIKESITGENAEVIYSTFDELPEHHTRVAEMTIERARRLVEHKKDVMILIDSITRLTRAYNQVVPPSGRTLSGGLDPAALHMPKRFFGAARNMREGGSLTILATALIETGSKMDDVVYEEFKGTGNMEMILDRKLQERRIFPAINIPKSSTRREDLLLMPDELEAVNHMRKGFNGLKADNAVDQVINLFSHTRNNHEFVRMIQRQML
ncbi:transcription termination factor Rho [Butyrivibrio fibrisolvens]|jgi:transcription termination factor Rho|uniref:Transcription termination factor Rho n=1 Tax=Butyrivibrio fibrisolvens TaxID=831 RepID=A0A1H9MHN8_BUTFI|nr:MULTISPECIES: transcription termination factor Rho [Butyrivibrio]MCR4636967.1 transcription termination factor Rho [Butyrivibrio sp.]SER23230.1 transcription termination factor Rho [Butyrivibrio fibrisolvens]